MEVVIPSKSLDFDFNDARPLPFFSAPSTPKGFGDLSLSAPASPSRVAEFYRYFDKLSPINGTSPNGGGNDDFAFDFSADSEKASLSADELFDGGKIKPLGPSPLQLQVEDQRSPLLSPRSPRSPIAKGKRIISNVFSKKKDSSTNPSQRRENVERGRELKVSSSRRAARSLSPHRVAQYPWEEEDKGNNNNNNKQSTSIASNTSIPSKNSSRKWSLRDFLLFRSASEGRASDKDPLKKYSTRKNDDVKNSNKTDNSKRKNRVSAHELHYTTNKAASQDLKKKTFLPYKQGILGRLAFNPTAHALSGGFGSNTR